MKRMIRGKCKECGSIQKFDIGQMTVEEAKEKLERTMAGECPGGGITPHVLIGNWWEHFEWIARYGIDEIAEVVEEDVEEPPTDEEWLAQEAAAGRKMMRTCDLPAGCEHMGFGEFRSETHDYLRTASPRGGRFYQEVPRS